MDWFVSFLEADALPLGAQACVLLALTWGDACDDLIVVENLGDLERSRGTAPGTIVAGLEQLQDLGWLRIEQVSEVLRFRLTLSREI